MTITAGNIADQVWQAVDGADATYDVDGIVAAIVQRYGLVSIEDIDHDAFWALVGEYDITSQIRSPHDIALAHDITTLAILSAVDDMLAEHGRDTVFFPARGNHVGGVRPEFEAELVRRAQALRIA